MKKILKSSLLVGAAVLGMGSIGVAQAATTTTPSTSVATADLTPGTITIGSTVPGFGFGTVASSADDVTYTSTTETGTLSLSDPGNASGYSVTVADTPFTATGGGTLIGAKLDFADTETNPLTTADADNVSTAPTFTGTLDVSTAPATVLDAALGKGVGAYSAAYEPTDASLMVPAGNIGGSYTSTLTWTLSNAPS